MTVTSRLVSGGNVLKRAVILSEVEGSLFIGAPDRFVARIGETRPCGAAKRAQVPPLRRVCGTRQQHTLLPPAGRRGLGDEGSITQRRGAGPTPSPTTPSRTSPR